MASGLGCVASRLEGVTDSIIQDRVNGRLVEPTNVEELANVLQELLGQPEVATDMGCRARQTVEMQFNYVRPGRSILLLIGRLTQDRRNVRDRWDSRVFWKAGVDAVY